MIVAIATDHNGVEQKKAIIESLTKLGYEVKDLSQNNTPTDDYPDYAKLVADKVASHESDFGILLCGTGIGMSIAANKVRGIRCAKVSTLNEAKLSREHNNANIIALSYTTPVDDLISIINIFLTTNFSEDERHVRRIQKIESIEANEH